MSYGGCAERGNKGILLDQITWSLCTAVAAAIFVWIGVTDFTLDIRSTALPILATAGLLTLSFAYRFWRPDEKVAGALTGVAQLIAFTAVGAPLSYLIASSGNPLWDETFHKWDIALGLNWRAYLEWVNTRPTLGLLLSAAYQSLTTQIAVAIMALGFTGRMLKMRVLVLSVMLSGVVTILVSGAMPAMAYFVHLGLQATDYPNISPAAAHVHVAPLQGLRDGSLRLISLHNMEGIITFPSYHAALGIILAYGFWAVPLLRWPGLILNIALVAATPIDGGHYFVDVMAGCSVAALSILAARTFAGADLRDAIARPLAFNVQTGRVGSMASIRVPE